MTPSWAFKRRPGQQAGMDEDESINDGRPKRGMNEIGGKIMDNEWTIIMIGNGLGVTDNNVEMGENNDSFICLNSKNNSPGKDSIKMASGKTDMWSNFKPGLLRQSSFNLSLRYSSFPFSFPFLDLKLVIFP
jgi:hypothetical protein